MNVVLDRGNRDEEFVSDLLVPEPTRHEPGYLDLPLGQDLKFDRIPGGLNDDERLADQVRSLSIDHDPCLAVGQADQPAAADSIAALLVQSREHGLDPLEGRVLDDHRTDGTK